MTADFSNLSPVSLDSNQFYGLIGVTTEGTARLFAPSAFGTVTSVGLSVPAGLVVTGSPVTTSGTIVLAFAPGYGIPTTVKQSEWNTAYNDKINTATFNTTNGTLTLTQQDGGTITVDLDGRYLTSVTESQTLTWNGATGELFISGGNTVDLDGRYLTSFTESDPVFAASPAAGITAPQISNWDSAFGWGNHAVAGYLLSSTAATTYQPLDGDLTSIAGLAGTAGLLRKTAANTWFLDFDPAYIGEVAYFNRPTKPTERSAGVPLVIGDRWYKNDDGTEWFWNGTYWLSPPQTYTGGSLTLPLYPFDSVFIHYVYVILVYISGVGDASNYYRLSLNGSQLWASAGAVVEFDAIPTTQIGYRSRPTFYGSLLINSVLTELSEISIGVVSTVGSPESRSTYLTAKVSEIFHET